MIKFILSYPETLFIVPIILVLWTFILQAFGKQETVWIPRRDKKGRFTTFKSNILRYKLFRLNWHPQFLLVLAFILTFLTLIVSSYILTLN